MLFKTHIAKRAAEGEIAALNWGNASHFEKPTFPISQMRKLRSSEAMHVLTMTNLENCRAGSVSRPRPPAALQWATDLHNVSKLQKGAKSLLPFHRKTNSGIQKAI